MTNEHAKNATPLDTPSEEAATSACAGPDAAAVNEAWGVEPGTPRGVRGLLFRLVSRLLQTRFDAQRTFNSQQVRLDNALLEHLEKRDTVTRAHFDRVLGTCGRHMEEINARHVALQKELVTSFDDLDRRLELVRELTERGRLSLQHELRRLDRRLERPTAPGPRRGDQLASSTGPPHGR